MIRFGKKVATAVVLVAATLARTADAASPADVSTARELYKQGADALDAGNAQVAVDKLTAAWALLQTPVIGLALARAHERLGHLIESREAAIAVLRMQKAADETPLSTAARTDADKLAAVVAPRVPHVLIVLHGASLDDTTVKLDGAAIPSVALKVPRQANPGAHTIDADTTDGRHGHASITLQEGETKDAPVEIPPAPVVIDKRTEPSQATPKPTAPPPEPERSSVSPVVWVGVAIGSAGLLVGAISGAMAVSATSTLGQKCPTIVNGTNICPASASSDLAFAQTAGTVATIGFVAVGVGAAFLVTGLLLGHRGEPRTRAVIAPMLGPITGITGTF